MLINFEDAYRPLSPYFDRLWGAIHGGWEDWKREASPLIKAVSTPRGQANLISDLIRARARTLAEQDQTIRVHSQGDSFLLVLCPKGSNASFGIRLKKLDANGFSKNQPTHQVFNFRHQIPLDGVDAKYHLEAGYVLDPLGQKISSIDLVCPAGDSIYWHAEITPKTITGNIDNLFDHHPDDEPKEVDVQRKKIAKPGDGNDLTGT